MINIFCVYLPARGCADDLETTLDYLGAIVEGTELGSFNVVCGDFNTLTLRAAKRGLTILEIFNLQTHFLENI